METKCTDQVWQSLRNIPRGQTRTYAHLAKDIGYR
ncbi:MGMT family protein [Alloacidobacterium dinghuense]|uniref:MGMT family protein n=1 Tax=Alloacidobacterium dinghuense TaxID=2763107 RepID=A0A7G8BJM2_9BACT|nr:MGMT family protein [Alloacidobacterium dinghuense]